MSNHVENTIQAINSNPAPCDIDRMNFIAMWESTADKVKQGSGDRLAVVMNGHRKVVYRLHDDRANIKGVYRACALRKKTPGFKGFFTELAADLHQEFGSGRFVVLDHGKGKADVASQFVEHDKNVANRIIDVVNVDLSAVNTGDIENAIIKTSQV